MKRIAMIIVLGALLAAPGCGSGASQPEVDASEGHAAFEERNFEEAFEILEPHAEAGDADAEFKIGFMYLHGRGTNRDYDLAVEWLEKAGEQGHAEAQYNMAMNYNLGRGVPEDLVQAHKWATMASAQGYRAAGELKEDTATRMTEDQVREAREHAATGRAGQ
jgi:TPR repeat protein